MNNVKNILKTANLIFGLLAILTIVLPNSAFGQRDLSRIFAPEGATAFNEVLTSDITNGCTNYVLLLNTGDLEGADADGSVFVTIHGTNGDTDKIEISGGLTVRDDKIHSSDGSTCLEVTGPAETIETRKYKALTFVRWGSNLKVVNSVLNTILNPFTRNKLAMVTINTHDVGKVESITLEHENRYPAWYLKSLSLYKGDYKALVFQQDVNRWFRADSLTQTFKVNQNSNVTDYRIKVFTGDVYQAGTNSNVYLTLNGRKQVIPNIELGKLLPGSNPFERNQTDETGIYDQPLTDGLSSITITLDKGARWFLGSIKIESPNFFFPAVFRYNNWIEGGSPVTIYPVEERVSPTRKITFRNEAGFNARMMIQYLENGTSPKFVFSADMPFAQNSIIEIPQDVKDAKVFLMGVGTVNDNFYASDFVGYLADDPCFKAWGTLFSPQGGTCDGKSVSTTATNPIRPSLYPKTVAEGEQSCFEMVQNVISYDKTGNKVWDVSNVKKLCQGTKDPYTTVACYGLRMPDVGPPTAIAECSGQIPFTAVSKPNNTQPPLAPTIAQNEQDCFNRVQNTVAYDTAGNKVWNENNIKNLCGGTTNPSATIACFSAKMPQLGWSQASKECAAANGSSQTQTANRMPVTSPTQRISPSLNLEGNWVMYDDKNAKFDKNAKIAQSGSNLSINNGYGTNSTAVLNGNAVKTSDGLNGTVSADGTRIDWDIKFVWVKQVSAPITNPIINPNNTQVSPNPVATKSLGTARDLDAKNGVVWTIGTNAVPGGYGIYKLDGSNWTQIDGGATRIAVDNTSNPWIINEDGMIFRRTGNAWTAIAGPNGSTPLDIAISNSGEVWIATDTGTVSRWTGSGWTNLIALSARRVIFTPNPDTFQIVDENGKRFVRQSGTSWIAATDASGMADKYLEFAIDSDGTKWGIDSSFNIWKFGGGQSQINAIVAETQVQPDSPITNATSPTKRFVTFKNEAGYVAKMMVGYFESGPSGVPLPKFLFTDNIPVGQNRTLEIPHSAPNMQVTISLIGSGTVKDNFYSTTLEGTFSGGRCFKAWGTLFSPQGGNCQ